MVDVLVNGSWQIREGSPCEVELEPGDICSVCNVEEAERVVDQGTLRRPAIWAVCNGCAEDLQIESRALAREAEMKGDDA